MFHAEDLHDWLGHDVVDESGAKIGEFEAIYVDTRTDEPAFATVKVGRLGRSRLVFVPLAGATVGPRHLKVAYPKKQVKDAPSIATDGGLLAADEAQVFRHYDMPYSAPENARLLARR
ncbi:MAG TPA: PRC-barrel domain-containing protein [Streptosporangiaceae bacterium]|nr:PRC-barrel domain-containing protein [Streptosporangiaceae bacterium]